MQNIKKKKKNKYRKQMDKIPKPRNAEMRTRNSYTDHKKHENRKEEKKTISLLKLSSDRNQHRRN